MGGGKKEKDVHIVLGAESSRHWQQRDEQRGKRDHRNRWEGVVWLERVASGARLFFFFPLLFRCLVKSLNYSLFSGVGDRNQNRVTAI